jgi:hypothetical protein
MKLSILPIRATTLLFLKAVLLGFGPGLASANDNFVNATVLTGVEAESFVGDISAYSLEAGEPLHRPDGLPSAGRSAWWKWTAPASGWVTVNTIGTSGWAFAVRGTTVGIYTGSAVNALTPVAKSSSSPVISTPDIIRHPRVTFFATIGQTYYFAVDGTTASDVGASNRTVWLYLRQYVPKNVTHYGTINFGDATPSRKGLVVASRTRKNAYSASMSLGGKTYRFRGRISPEGSVLLAVPSTSPTVPDLQIELCFGGQGSITVFDSINSTQEFNLLQVVRFNAQLLNTIEGYFTHNLSNSGDSTSLGYGILSVNRSGRVTGVMVLPDGVRVPWSAPLCDNDPYVVANVYRTTFGNQGYVVGQFYFEETGLIDEFEFYGSYFRPVGATNNTFYPLGLHIPDLSAVGATYTPPALLTRALGFLDPTNGAGFLEIFSVPSENIPLMVSEGLTWSLVNTISFQDPVTNQPKLKLNPKKGLITGQIKLPGAPKRKIQAILYLDGGPRVSGFATGLSRNVGLRIVP